MTVLICTGAMEELTQGILHQQFPIVDCQSNDIQISLIYTLTHQNSTAKFLARCTFVLL